MNIPIDTNAVFTLRNNTLKVCVDALDLDEFVSSLWKTDSSPTIDPKTGSQAIGPAGEPVVELKWEIIDTKFAAWLKEQGVTEVLKRSEVRAIWSNAREVWAKKNEAWQSPAAAAPSSPTSPPSTPADPRLSQD